MYMRVAAWKSWCFPWLLNCNKCFVKACYSTVFESNLKVVLVRIETLVWF